MGQFPELCYSSLLQPFVDKTGMADARINSVFLLLKLKYKEKF